MAEIRQDLKLQIDPSTIVRPNIVTDCIPDGAVTADKLATDAVTESKILDGAVTEDKIDDGAVTRDKIANQAVISSKIGNNAVTNEKIQSMSSTKLIKSRLKLADQLTTGMTFNSTYSLLASLVSQNYLYPKFVFVTPFAFCYGFLAMDKANEKISICFLSADGTISKAIIWDDTHTTDDFLNDGQFSDSTYYEF